MIQIEREKLEKVLAALEDHDSWHGDKTQQAITIIKDVLAQPEQELVEWYSIEGETRRYGVGMVECAYAIGRDEVVHVVTHESVKDVAMKHLPTQHTWVGLTDEEIEASKPPLSNDAVVWELAVEWAQSQLKEKNT